MDPFDFYMILVDLGISKTKMAKELKCERSTLDKAIEQFLRDNYCNNARFMILFSRLQKYDAITKEVLAKEVKSSSEYLNEIQTRLREICSRNIIQLERVVLKKYEDAILDHENESSHIVDEDKEKKHIDEIDKSAKKLNVNNDYNIIDLSETNCKKCDTIGSLVFQHEVDTIECLSCNIKIEPSEYFDFKHSKKIIRGKSKKNKKHYIGQTVEFSIKEELADKYLVVFDHVRGTVRVTDFPELRKGDKLDLQRTYKGKIYKIDGTYHFLNRVE